MSWPHPRRLYAPELPAEERELELVEESQKHARVLRLREGDELELFDAAGHSSLAKVLDATGKRVLCKVAPRRHAPPEPRALHLCLGLPKGDKLDHAVRMLTELGAASIHIAQTERAVPKPAGMQTRLARLGRITREACAQSGQAYAPVLHAPADLETIARRAAPSAMRWVLWEESTTPRPHAPEQPPAEMWVVVGPEGGLSKAEVSTLRAQGFVDLSIGASILRFETAVITAATLALDYLGRLR